MQPDPPKSTGRWEDVYTGDITGWLFPWDGEQPVLLRMPDSPHQYLPLFKSPEDLKKVMERANASYRSIKQVVDGVEFYQSIHEQRHPSEGSELKVILDLYFLPNGRVRFSELRDL
jgi:hypothetical protein